MNSKDDKMNLRKDIWYFWSYLHNNNRSNFDSGLLYADFLKCWSWHYNLFFIFIRDCNIPSTRWWLPAVFVSCFCAIQPLGNANHSGDSGHTHSSSSSGSFFIHIKQFFVVFLGIQLTWSEHHPHDLATWMHSPHDCAFALMHMLPSEKRQHKQSSL